MIVRFLLISLAAALAALFAALPFFKLNFGGQAVGVDYKSLVAMILGWVPTGLFQPFIDSNAMQLIIMGAVFGVGILVLNGDTPYLVGLLNDINRLLLKAMSWIASLIPVFVAVMIVSSIWSSTVAALLSAWKSWVITTGMQLIVILVMIAVTVIRYKVSPKILIRKISRTFLIALGTNSCTASIPENYRCCETKLGIDSKVYTFGIPIGTTVFKPATAVRLVLLCLFMAESQATPVSAGWIIMLVIMALMLSIATPAIPGGTLMFCPLLFTQMGIPTAVIAQMLTTDVFFDCTCTAFNQIAVELSLASYAGSISLIDKDVMRSQ